MSISSDRLRELVGEKESIYLFGRKHERELFKVISEDETYLTEEKFIRGLSKCEFRNPEKVSLITLFCPVAYLEIIDRVIEDRFRSFYKIFLCFWYCLFIVNIVSSFYHGKFDGVLCLMIMCSVITSWAFREFTRRYNRLELIYLLMKER